MRNNLWPENFILLYWWPCLSQDDEKTIHKQHSSIRVGEWYELQSLENIYEFVVATFKTSNFVTQPTFHSSSWLIMPSASVASQPMKKSRDNVPPQGHHTERIMLVVSETQETIVTARVDRTLLNIKHTGLRKWLWYRCVGFHRRGKAGLVCTTLPPSIFFSDAVRLMDSVTEGCLDRELMRSVIYALQSCFTNTGIIERPAVISSPTPFYNDVMISTTVFSFFPSTLVDKERSHGFDERGEFVCLTSRADAEVSRANLIIHHDFDHDAIIDHILFKKSPIHSLSLTTSPSVDRHSRDMS